MEKVAVFVEGQSELIFLRNILFHLIDPSKFSFRCLRLHAEREHDVEYTYTSPRAEVYFQIINVGNDEKVLSAIKDRVPFLFNKGFSKIIGLRDLLSKTYRGENGGKINEGLNQKYIDKAQGIVATLTDAHRIHLHFSIMELEAWWLSMYNLLAKINNVLTVDFINRNLGYDLSQIDPQTQFLHPSVELDKILKFAGLSYNKSFSEVENITSKIEPTDIENAIENERCRSFKAFCDDVISN